MSTVIGNVNSVSKIFVYQPTYFYEKWLSCKLYHVLSSLRVVAPRAQKWLNTFIKLNLNLICTKWFINLSDIKNIKFQIYIFLKIHLNSVPLISNRYRTLTDLWTIVINSWKKTEKTAQGIETDVTAKK